MEPVVVTLGEVELTKDLNNKERDLINSKLVQHGFELIDDKKSKLIEKMKTTIINQIHYVKDRPKLNFSDLIANELNKDYTYLTNLFSEIEGITIEQFIILQKIERAKELLVYDEMNLSEIAVILGYSSVGHLSNQFKKVTGLTPTYFKSVKGKKRLPLDQVKTVNDVKQINKSVTKKR
jgi:AraC-like DNA-binding protein